jgi:hypothetical protein
MSLTHDWNVSWLFGAAHISIAAAHVERRLAL